MLPVIPAEFWTLNSTYQHSAFFSLKLFFACPSHIMVRTNWSKAPVALSRQFICHAPRQTLQAKLTGVVYHPDNTSTWAKDISDEIKLRVKEQGWDRYKYVVQVCRQHHHTYLSILRTAKFRHFCYSDRHLVRLECKYFHFSPSILSRHIAWTEIGRCKMNRR